MSRPWKNAVRAGALHHRVALQEQAKSAADAFGGVAYTWSTVEEAIPADVTPLSGEALFRAKQVHAEATIQLQIRFDPRIKPDSSRLLLEDGRVLSPLSVVPDDRDRWQIVLCKERLEPPQAV